MKTRAIYIARSLFVLISLFFFHAANSSVFDECKGHAAVARSIMEMRQSGESMTSMMDAASRMKEFREPAETMIRMAFDRPAMRSKEGKAREVVEFEGEVLSRCLDSKDPR